MYSQMKITKSLKITAVISVVLLFIIFLVIWNRGIIESSDIPTDINITTNESNDTITDSNTTPDIRIVSEELASRVAHYYATLKGGFIEWDQVQISSPVTYYDLNNVPAVYVFTIYKGDGLFPTEEAILNNVSTNREKRLKAEELLREAKEASNIALTEDAKTKISEAWRLMRDEQEFGTLIIGANEEHSPAIAKYNGLPPHLVGLYDAVEIAKEKLQLDNVEVSKYLWPGIFEACFEISSGTKTIFVNMYSFKVYTEKEFIPREAEKSEEKKEKIKSKWKVIKDLVGWKE